MGNWHSLGKGYMTASGKWWNVLWMSCIRKQSNPSESSICAVRRIDYRCTYSKNVTIFFWMGMNMCSQQKKRWYWFTTYNRQTTYTEYGHRFLCWKEFSIWFKQLKKIIVIIPPVGARVFVCGASSISDSFRTALGIILCFWCGSLVSSDIPITISSSSLSSEMARPIYSWWLAVDSSRGWFAFRGVSE